MGKGLRRSGKCLNDKSAGALVHRGAALESLTEQFCSFIAALLIGVLVGFCYDYYRAVKKIFELKKVGTWLGDVLFWVATTALVFFLLILGNWGVVRYYVFFGLGLGACIYFKFFSKSMSRLVWFKFYLLEKLWALLVQAALLLLHIVLIPLRLFVLILSYPLNFLGTLLKKTGRLLRVYFNNMILARMKRALERIKLIFHDFVLRKKKK